MTAGSSKLVGDEANGVQRGATSFELPAVMRSAHEVGCYAFDPNTPADCTEYEGSPETVDVATTAGRHPPFYYAIVGLPSLVDADAPGVYAMRILSLIHISEPTRRTPISYAVFCLKKK